MTPVYGTHDNCFQACIASVLHLPLSEVPDFYKGIPNGKPVPQETVYWIDSWMKKRDIVLLFLGYTVRDIIELLDLMSLDLAPVHYIITGSTASGMIHSVVAKGDRIIHDPGTEPGHHTITGPCPDGYFRTTLFLKAV